MDIKARSLPTVGTVLAVNNVHCTTQFIYTSENAFDQFLPLDEAVASIVVIVIVSG